MDTIKLVVRKSRTNHTKLSFRIAGDEEGSIRGAVTSSFQEGDTLSLALHRRGSVAVGQIRQWKGLRESFGQPHPAEALTFEVVKLHAETPVDALQVEGRYTENGNSTYSDLEHVQTCSVVLKEPNCNCLAACVRDHV